MAMEPTVESVEKFVAASAAHLELCWADPLCAIQHTFQTYSEISAFPFYCS